LQIDVATLKDRDTRVGLIKKMREDLGVPPEKNPHRMKSNGKRRG
jgi:hypothetical protein